MLLSSTSVGAVDSAWSIRFETSAGERHTIKSIWEYEAPLRCPAEDSEEKEECGKEGKGRECQMGSTFRSRFLLE